MKTFRVGVILSTTYVVDAEDEDEAMDIAGDMTLDDYPYLNFEECNFVEEE